MTDPQEELELTPPKKIAPEDAPAEEPEAPPAEEPVTEQELEDAPHPGRVHESLAEAMAWVWGEVRRVKKTGQHPKQGWKFATESDIADLIRQLCSNAGLVIRQTLHDVAEREIGSTSNGNPIHRYTVRVGYTITNGREDWPEQMWQGQADDSSDKGMAKALTACRKTFLIATFQVSSGDDPDNQESPEVQRSAGMRAARGTHTGPASGDYPSPTANAAPVTDEQRGEAARIKLMLIHESQGANRIEEEAFNTFVANYCVNEIGEPIKSLNRDQFEMLLSKLREQAAKFAPGFNPKTGEWAPGTGPVGAPVAGEAQTPAEAPAAAPAPAEAAPAPAPVDPEHEQKIIEQAAAAKQETPDPDKPAESVYAEALGLAKKHGIEEGQLLTMMMEAGAARPTDLDTDPVRGKFLELLNTAITAANPPAAAPEKE